MHFRSKIPNVLGQLRLLLKSVLELFALKPFVFYVVRASNGLKVGVVTILDPALSGGYSSTRTHNALMVVGGFTFNLGQSLVSFFYQSYRIGNLQNTLSKFITFYKLINGHDHDNDYC